MCGPRLRLFSVLNIPVAVDAGGLAVLVWLAWALAGAFPDAAPGLEPGAYRAMGAATALLFFGSVLLHELGHAAAARPAGVRVRGIVLSLIGGVAELDGEPTSAGGEFLMAAAGPGVSAVLVGVFWGLSALAGGAVAAAPVTAILFYLAWANGLIAVFNLVPAFPLDGGRMLRAGLWAAAGDRRRAGAWAGTLGQGLAGLLVGLGFVLVVNRQFVAGAWLGFTGMMLTAAGGEAQAGGKDASAGLAREIDAAVVAPTAGALADLGAAGSVGVNRLRALEGGRLRGRRSHAELVAHAGSETGKGPG